MRVNSLLTGVALAAIATLGFGVAAQAQDTKTKWDGAPSFSSGDASFKVRGRLLVDAVFQDVDRSNGQSDYSTRNIRGRQMYIGVEGNLDSKWAYKLEGGFVNGGTSSWDDAVIEYKATKTTSIMVGNIKTVGLESLTSTRFTTFMDRGAFESIGTEGYLLGAAVKTVGSNWSTTFSVQGNSLNSADVNVGCTAVAGTNCSSKERIVTSARLTYVPLMSRTDTIHLGGWVRYRDFANEGAYSYGTRANTNYGATFMATDKLAASDTTVAGEFAWLHDNFSVQAEYANIGFDRVSGAKGGSGDVRVGYVFATWSPTGEKRAYSTKGEFGRLKVSNPVDKGGLGAWEVAVRYDYADTKDAWTNQDPTAQKTAGIYNAGTFGVNYYPTSNTKIALNYTVGSINTTNNPNQATFKLPIKTDVNTLQMRLQLDY